MGYKRAGFRASNSSGNHIQRGSITKTGNAHLRRVMVEAAWAYQRRPWVGGYLAKRLQNLDQQIKDMAWKAASNPTPRRSRISIDQVREPSFDRVIQGRLAFRRDAIQRSFHSAALAEKSRVSGSPKETRSLNFTTNISSRGLLARTKASAAAVTSYAAVVREHGPADRCAGGGDRVAGGR